MADRTPITPFRFEDDTLDQIERLKTALQPQAIGRDLTRADVVRHALNVLEAQILPTSTVKKKKKKSQNSS